MAALRAGADTVIIPRENEPDLAEIDQEVRSRLKFITAEHIDDVLHVALDFTGVKPWQPEKNAAAEGSMLPLPAEQQRHVSEHSHAN